MTRYELIMHDAEKMASELPYNEQYPAKCGYLKAEIKHLCNEIETLEARCANQNLTNPDAYTNRKPARPATDAGNTALNAAGGLVLGAKGKV